VSLEFFVDIKSFPSHYGPGVDSTFNRNEYQEQLLGGGGEKATGTWGGQPSHPPGNLDFLEPSGPLQACSGTALPLPLQINFCKNYFFSGCRDYYLPLPTAQIVPVSGQFATLPVTKAGLIMSLCQSAKVTSGVCVCVCV